MKGLIEDLIHIWENPDAWTRENFKKAKKLYLKALKFQIYTLVDVVKKTKMTPAKLSRCIESLIALQKTKEVLLEIQGGGYDSDSK